MVPEVKFLGILKKKIFLKVLGKMFRIKFFTQFLISLGKTHS